MKNQTITITDTITRTITTEKVFTYMSTQDVEAWYNAHDTGDSEEVVLATDNGLEMVTLTRGLWCLIVAYESGDKLLIEESAIAQFFGVKSY